MRTSRQLAYLEALEIPVWVRKDRSPVSAQVEEPADEAPAAEAPTPAEMPVRQPSVTEAPQAEISTVGLRLGPGSSRFLLLCADADETSSKLAADIARALDEAPVWAWPETAGEGAVPESVMQEHLFTAMIVFGEKPARRVFGASIPEMIGPARVLVAPDMAELLADPGARNRLWKIMVANSLAVKP